MAVTHKPVFAQAPREVNAVVTGANTNYATPTNVVKLCDAGPDGSLLVSLHALMLATLTTASKLQLYKSMDNGTTFALSENALMAAHTIAATTETPKTDFSDITDDTPKYMEPGSSYWVGSSQALAGGIAFSGRKQDF